MPDPLSITVYSDVICPWCYVGKRRLEAAINDPGPEAAQPPAIVRFAWRPFELNPDMPAGGMERTSYRTRKFGEARARELDLKMAETGRELGIAFAFERMQRTPNTRLAHRLIWEAGLQERQDAMVERLFHGYFEEGIDIGAADTLRALARECGLEERGVEAALTESASLEAVTQMEQQGYAMGIQGVPFFILWEKYGVSGAQPPEFWRDALPKIAAQATAAKTPTSA